jgi:hypothetical protein
VARAIAIEALSRGLETAASLSMSQASDRAPSLLQLLVERSGIVQERSPGIFAFAHLSFQDYLADRWFVGAGAHGLSELAAMSSEPRHAEVIRFAVAILAADQHAEADERALRLVREVATNIHRTPIVHGGALLLYVYDNKHVKCGGGGGSRTIQRVENT